jgi:16S rRNA (adenine1518-N6/adenine1519-N6)-dimethyltransferase
MKIKAKKHLGQNFLQAPSIVQRIVKAANLSQEDKVLEIGPGLGILTTQLLPATKEVLALELDESLIPTLQENLEKELTPEDIKRLTILHQDALKFDPTTHKTTSKDYKIVANIPYYITSPLITHFLTSANPPKSLTLLVQKEVAEKICAQTPSQPNLKQSILSIQTQLYANPHLAFGVPAKHFSPKPRVDSAVIHLEAFETPKYKHPERILQLAKSAYSQRRKKLSNTLKNFPELTALPEFDNFKDLRPEHLTLEDWDKLAEQIAPHLTDP